MLVSRRSIPVLVLLAAYGALLLWRFSPGLASVDGNGYWKAGRLIAETGRAWFELETPTQFVGFHWLRGESGKYYSRYPLGLPLIIAAAYKLGGGVGGLLVTPLLALLTAAGVYCLSRRLINGPTWPLVAMGLYMVNPVAYWHGVLCYSHTAVTCCLVWGFTLLLKWRQSRGWTDAFFGGMIMGLVPTIRYAEGILVLPILVLLAMSWRGWRSSWPGYAAAAFGALTPVVPMLLRNHSLYGAFWRTGYALTNEDTAFAGEFFAETFHQYLTQLVIHGLGLLMFLGLAGCAMMIFCRRTRSAGVFLITTIVVLTGVYASYYGSRNLIAAFTLRFLLPTFPAYIVGGTWLLSGLANPPQGFRSRGLGRLGPVIAWACVLVQICWPGYEVLSGMSEPARFKRAFAQAARIMRDYVPQNSVVIGHPQFLQHLDYEGRWRLVDVTVLDYGALYRDRKLEDDGEPGGRPAGAFRLRLSRYADLSPKAYTRAVADDIGGWAGDSQVFRVAGVWEHDMPQPGAFDWKHFQEVIQAPLAAGKPVDPDVIALIRKQVLEGGLSRQEMEQIESAGKQLCLGNELYIGKWER